MTIRISMTIPNSQSGQGKFGIVLPDDVESAAAGDLVANTLRILRDEPDRPDKALTRLAEEAAFGVQVDLNEKDIDRAIKAGKLDKDGYPPVDFSGVTK